MVKKTWSVRDNSYRQVCKGRVAVYFDSFNLYHGLRDADRHAKRTGGPGWRHCYWYNPMALAQNLVPSDCSLSLVRFFTARILGAQPEDDESVALEREGKRKRQQAVLEAIQVHGIEILEGVYSPRRNSCFHCRVPWTSFEEKMTDTKIAVQILVDAIHDRFDTCVVISADADIAPPLEALQTEFPVKSRIVVSPPHRNAQRHLQQVARCFKLTREVIESCLLPNPTIRPDGFAIHRPAEWAMIQYPHPEQPSHD